METSPRPTPSLPACPSLPPAAEPWALGTQVPGLPFQYPVSPLTSFSSTSDPGLFRHHALSRCSEATVGELGVLIPG